MRTRTLLWLAAPAALIGALPVTVGSVAAHGRNAGPDGWTTAIPVDEVNSLAPDGCPIESPNGRELFIASARSGSLGAMDIYVANRKSDNDPWSAPVQLEAPVNSTANDFCPTPLPGGSLLFVSNRTDADQDCNTVAGAGDIYYTRLHPVRAPQEPVNLGCEADGSGPNFGGAEFSPSLVTTDEGTWLFFSSTGLASNQDIYVSELGADGRYGTPARVDELSTGSADQMPNVSPDGRVIVFLSNRPDLAGSDLDVFMATRASVTDAWSPPVRLGPEVNGAGDESRPTMSADGHRLYFGRSGDIWMSTQ